MAGIKSIGTAVPSNSYSNPEILAAASSWLSGNSSELGLFERFVDSARTSKRYFSKPLDDILRFNGMSHRAEIFEDTGTELGTRSLQQAVEKARIDASELDAFIFTSCSAPVIPSIDCLLVEKLGMKRSISRVPIYQHGCAGGVIGLALANRFAAAGVKVALTSVELCSLGFQYNNLTAANLVGSAIFGDGAATVIVTPESDGLVFLDSQSILTNDSRHLMGFDIRDDGVHLRLDKELPGFLSKAIPGLVNEILSRNGLKPPDIQWWLFHPGGARILTALEESFMLEPEQAAWSWEVLRDFGNLSSASILFVTSRFLESSVAADGDYVMMVGVGPGLTVELILFEMRKGPR